MARRPAAVAMATGLALLGLALVAWSRAANAQAAPSGAPIRLQMSPLPAELPRPAASRPGASQPPAPPDRFGEWLGDPQRCSRTPPVDTRQPLQLGSVLSVVICRYPNVRIGDALAQQSQAALNRALAQGQPTLGLSAGFDASRGQPSAGTVELRAEWVLFDFGVRDAATRQARQAMQAVLDDQRAEALAAAAQAANLFAASQAAWGRFDAAATNLRIALDNARAANARFGAGAATLPEKLQAETAAAQSRVEHGRAMRQWFLARGELALALGLPSNEPLEVVAPTTPVIEAHTAPDTEALINEALERHPRIAAARSRLAEGQARSASVEASRWGSVAINGRVGQVRASSDSAVGSTASASIGWSVPLFDRQELRYRRDDAQADVLARTMRVDEAERQVVLLVWQEAQALLGERDGLGASKQVLENATTALQVASERFRQGVGAFADVLTAQTAAANARFQWVEARANLSRAELRLAAAVGRFGPMVAR